MLLSIKETKDDFTNDIMYLSAFCFYRKRKLSLGVKSRQIIGTFFEMLGLFLGPVFHRLKGRNVAQCFLRDVLIVDLNVAFDGIGEVLGGVEAGGG